MSTEQLNKLLRQAEALSAEEKLLLAKRLIEQADSNQALTNPLSHRTEIDKRYLYLKWLKEHQAEYAGRYVALDGERLLSDGATYREVAEAAKKSGAENSFIVHVPDPNSTYFAGW